MKAETKISKGLGAKIKKVSQKLKKNRWKIGRFKNIRKHSRWFNIQ